MLLKELLYELTVLLLSSAVNGYLYLITLLYAKLHDGKYLLKISLSSALLKSDLGVHLLGLLDKKSCGTCMNKFTGSGGKSGSNDASAEFIGEVRRMFAEGGVVWQTAELGKVDAGGGGTVAKYLSKLNIDTVDLGVPVLSMHAPYEVISKADLYSNYKAFLAFMK